MRHFVIEALEQRRMLASDLSSAPAAGEGPALYMDVSQALVFQSRDAGGLTTLKSIDPTESSATPTSLSLAGMPAGASVSEPEWSPNGNWLLFAQEGSQQLYVLNSFDGRLLPVVDSNAAPIVGLNPTWAGDSSTIGWAGPARFGGSIPNLDIMEGTLQFYQDHALLVGQTNLTDSPAAEFRPDWSPDGTKLVYDSSASGAGDLYLMDFAAKIGQRHPTMNLTADRPTTSESEADFSPDGTHIVFRSSQGNVDLWVMNVDGSGKTQLTNTPGDELAPTWSPDGSKIAYSLRTLADGVSSQDIYMMNADGSGSEQLTFTAASESCPTWRKSTALPSDVSIEISGPANVTEKESFEYTITVGNTGLVAATDVTVTLEADARMALESAAGGAIQDGQAVFHIPALAMGATVHYTVRAHTIVPGTMLVDATVSLPTDSDPVPQNNFASWMLNARPANDDFANASVLPSGRGSLPFATFNATAQANILGQPEPAHAFNSNGAPIFSSNTIWYRWFAGAAGHATFTTAGSNFDTVLAAYYITNANGVPKLQQVASNDDADSSTSKIEFDAFKDESYYIAVGGFQSTRGTGYLSWSNTPQVIPAPQPQHIFSLSRPSTLVGNAPLDLRLLGSGFDGASRVYVLDDYESPNAIQFRAHNFLTTTFRSNGHELETQLPARYLARPGTLRIVAVRNNEISNVVELHVTANEVLPAGSSVALGKVRALADVILHQAAAGAGEGETGVEVYKLEGHVNFNKYLSVDGASIELQIDRAANSMRVRIQEGSILLTNVPRYNTITLWRGADFEFTLDGEGELTNLLRATVETPLRDKGIEVGIDRAHLLLGTTLDQAGRPIYGIEIFGSLKFQQIAGLVNVPLQFQKLVLTQNDGLRFSGEIGPINFSIGGLVQLQEAYLSFQAGATPQEDSFRGRAKIATAVLSASGSVELKNGVINSVSGGLDLPALTGLPLGPLNITGGSLGLENLLTPESLQVRIGANATIAHPAVAKVISLHDVGIYYRLPAAFGGDGSLQIFQVPAASASLDLDLSANHYTFGGQVELLPSFPIFEVRGELTASLGGSQGLNLSGYAEGIVQIPDGNGGLYDVLKACGHVAGFEFGPCLKFPMEIASAKLSYQNNAFSFSTNLPIVGKTALRIKQVQNGVQAAIDLFHNIPGIATHYVFGAGGEGEILDNTIGTFAMPADSPKLIVSVSATDAAPLYDLIDPAGNRYTPLTIGTIGGTFFQNTETNGSFYVIDNPMAGQWTAEAQIGVTGPLDFQAWGANAAPELSDVAVQASGDGYQISYVATDKDDDPRVSLYYTTSPTATNGTLIAGDMLASETQSFYWDAAGTDVPSGTYYIYAMIDDGLNTPAALFAPEPVTVSNPLAPATPIVTSLRAVENAIDVQWQPVYAADLAGYQVWYGLQDGDQVNYTGHVDAGQSTSFRLKGLEPGKTYAVSVVAYDSSQEEDPLNPGTMTTHHRFSLPSSAQMITTGSASPPEVFFTEFSQGNKLVAGTNLEMAWSVTEDTGVARQQLFITLDGGATYQLLAQLDPSDRQASWPVPADISLSDVGFRITVQDEAGNTSSAETGGSFSTLPAGAIAFASDAVEASEHDGWARLRVVRTGGSAGAVTVQYVTAPGTAVAVDDYEHVSGELTFLDGETEQTLLIPIVDDRLVEDDQTFTVELRLPGGGAKLDGAEQTTVTLHDDDTVTDTDGDGIDDAIEALAPGNGDGNQDGTPDSQQANVASYHDSASGRGLTISVPSGTTLANVQLLDPQVLAAPAFAGAIGGAVSFEVHNVTSGQGVPIEVRSHASEIDTFLLHDVTAKNAAPHWYYAESAATGTAFETGKLTVQVKDGGAGDRDHAANGSLLVIMAAGTSVHAQKHQNQLNAMDVNGDEFISPLDALLIINNLNTSGARALGAMPSPLPSTFYFLDPSGDGYVSPLDALLIINQLNSRPSGEGEQNLAEEDQAASQVLQSHAWASEIEHPNAEIAWAYDWYTDLADEASGGRLFKA